MTGRFPLQLWLKFEALQINTRIPQVSKNHLSIPKKYTIEARDIRNKT